MEGADNLYDMFTQSVQRFGDNECLGWRPTVNGKAQPFKWLTYNEVAERADKVAGGLVPSGGSQQGRCAVFSANCPEWMITMQARTAARSSPGYNP